MVDRLVRLDAVWEADLPNLTEIQIARGEAGSKRVARDHGRWTSLLAAGEGAVIDASRMHLRMDSCRWVIDHPTQGSRSITFAIARGSRSEFYGRRCVLED